MSLLQTQILLPEQPVQWVAGLARPSWDAFFMMQVFSYLLRSPDQQTKQGAVIVDWPTKTILGAGYNGHPRGVEGLPTMRAGSALVTFDGDDDRDPNVEASAPLPKAT